MKVKDLIAKSIDENFDGRERVLSGVLNKSGNKNRRFRPVAIFALTVVLTVSVFFAVWAATTKSAKFTLTADYETRNPGDTVTITASVNDMTAFKKGVYGFTVDIEFNKSLFDFDVAYNNNAGVMAASGIDPDFKILSNLSADNTVTVLFYADNDSGELKYLAANTALFTLQFKAKTGASGSAVFTPKDCKIADAAGEAEDATPASGFELVGVTPTEATVTVAAKAVTSLTVTTQPTNKTYKYGVNTSFDSTGMVLTANYNNGTSATIATGYTATLSWDYGTGKTIVLTSTENPAVKATITGVTYNKGTLTDPTITNTVTYTPTLKLNALTLSAGWQWANGDTALTCISPTSANVVYTGANAGNYENETRSINIPAGKVAKSEAYVAAPTEIPVSIASGYTKLDNIPGDYKLNWEWVAPNTALPTAGNSGNFDLRYKDTDNYVAKVVSVKVTVSAKITPHIATKPTAAAVTYDPAKKLSDITLNGGAAQVGQSDSTAVSGSFAWQNATTTTPTCDKTEYNVIFTPTSTNIYNTVTFTVSLTVNKAAPVVTWPASTAITYGAKLNTSAFTGGSSTPAGTFAWVNGDTVPTVTNSGYEVKFTPNDIVNYNTATQNVAITVNPNPNPVYTLPVIEHVELRDGLKLSDITLPANWTWVTSGDTALAEAKEYTFTAKYTPTDANYSPKEVEISFTVTSLPAFDKTEKAGDTDVTVTSPAGVIPGGTVLKVEEKSLDSINESTNTKLKEKIGENAKIVSLLDIDLVNDDGEAADILSPVAIKVKLAAQYVGKTIKIVQIDEQSNITDMNAVIENGYALFNTATFNSFAIVELSEISGGESEVESEVPSNVESDVKSDDISNAETGDSFPFIMFAVLIFALSAVAFVLLRKRSRV